MTPSESFITANGLKHHVLSWGDGPDTIVCCHGFLDIAWSFDGLARRLANAGYRVIAFDWRGHGETDWIGAGGYYHFADYALDLDQLLAQVAPEPLHLLGHSMGGSVCVMYAGARPERIKTLTLLEGLGPPDGFGGTDVPKRLRNWFQAVQRARTGEPRLMQNIDAALKRMRVQNPELPDELGRFLAEKSTRPVSGGLVWGFDPLHRTVGPNIFSSQTFAQFLQRIEAPTLVIAGERGYRLPDEQTRLQAIAKHQFVELPDVGHMLHWFRPDALARSMLPFLGAA